MKNEVLFVMDESVGFPQELWDNFERLYNKAFSVVNSQTPVTSEEDVPEPVTIETLGERT